MASILEKGKEKETSTKGVAAPKGQSENPTGSSSSDEPGEEGGDTTKRKRQTEEEETDKYIQKNYPNDITTETSIGLSFGIVFIAAILINLLML
jgi:hypothetical protein